MSVKRVTGPTFAIYNYPEVHNAIFCDQNITTTHAKLFLFKPYFSSALQDDKYDIMAECPQRFEFVKPANRVTNHGKTPAGRSGHCCVSDEANM